MLVDVLARSGGLARGVGLDVAEVSSALQQLDVLGALLRIEEDVAEKSRSRNLESRLVGAVEAFDLRAGRGESVTDSEKCK
jgi:hypothetical protein